MHGVVLNRRLILEEAQSLPDGAGGFVQTWVALGALWVRISPGSGRETAENGATLSSVPYRIVVRAAPVGSPSRPRPDQRFRRGTQAYKILAVSEDAEGRYLTCFAQEEVAA